jgi:hypothetical protein
MTERENLYLFYRARSPIIIVMRSLRVPHAIRRLMASRDYGNTEVHFHQGPQAQPTPCFDEHCPSPRLSV